MATLRVGVIGRGAIGNVIARHLAADRVEGAVLAGVLEAGKDLVVLSAGALADPATEARLRAAGPGRMLISTGAIGGLDIARAMLEAGNLEDISIRSTTTPAALSDVGTVPQVTAEDGLTLVLAGTARDVALRFPRVANVAATVALATLGLDVVRAELWVDPIGTRKRHELAATAGDSRLDVRIENNLSEDNPRTSAVTPYAVSGHPSHPSRPRSSQPVSPIPGGKVGRSASTGLRETRGPSSGRSCSARSQRPAALPADSG